MPTVLRIGPYRFMFFASDKGEPPHVHVKRDDLQVKVWLDPVRVAYNAGFAEHELNRIIGLTERHREFLLRKWHEFFDD
jgi:hypothetical protein